jgi:hypothetical protein
VSSARTGIVQRLDTDSTILRQSGANLVALLLTSIAGILAVRLSGAVAFTHYAQALAATSIGHLIVTQRLEVLLLSSGAEQRERVLTVLRRVAFPALATITASCIVAFLVVGPSVRAAVLLVIPAVVAVHGLTEVLSADRAARRSFGALAANRMVFAVALVIAIPISSVVSTTGVALLVADLVARTTALVPLTRREPLDGGDPGTRTALDIGEFRRSFLPAAAVSVVSIALIPLVGPALFRPERLAALLVVYRIASSLTGAIGRAVSLISPVTMAAERGAAIDREYRAGITRGAVTALAMCLAGIGLSFTPWRSYATAAFAVAPWLFAIGVAQVTAALFVARRWFSWSLRMTLVDTVLTCAGIALGVVAGSLTFGVGAYGFGAVAAAFAFAAAARQRDAPANTANRAAS